VQSTRLSLGLLSGLIFVAMALSAGATHAATSDGRYFPCADSFAKKVAIESGFAEVAAEFNPAYEDPEYWLAQQTVCADFDLDGNDEIVFTLGAMGGTDPWAFFDVPNGQASASTYSFPTIYDKGNYPNHALELVRVEGAPAIRDKRRLFRPRDAHCCPTGGLVVSIVGFREGRYEVLGSRVQKPPPLHKVRLTVAEARTAVSAFLERKYEAAWYDRNGGRLNCNRRLSFNTRKCSVAFQIGDSYWFGDVRIGLMQRGPSDKRARIHYRITRLNEYCAAVQHGSPAECQTTSRGSAIITN
jgi:hypothetical protein